MSRFKPILFLIVFLVLGQSLSAQESLVSISIDKRSLTLGESAIFTITAKKDSVVQPTIPSTEDLEIQFIGSKKQSFSNFNIVVNGKKINGHASGSSTLYNYRVTPKRVGELSFPGFTIITGPGTGVNTQPFSLQVYEQPDLSKDIFARIELDKDVAYLGEDVVATFKWYLSKDVEGYQCSIPWYSSLKNFALSNPELDKSKQYIQFIVNGSERVYADRTTEVVDGKKFAVVSFQKILKPIKVGQYQLEPATIQCDIVKSYQKRRGTSSFFDDFFSGSASSFFGIGDRAITEAYTLESNSPSIEIRDIPLKNRPKDFGGAVGVFDFDLSVEPKQAKVGEAITITMNVSGKGNLEQVSMPFLPAIEGFREYEPQSSLERVKEGESTKLVKKFEKIIIPAVSGSVKIPEVSFTYFDSTKQKYKTLSKGPINLKIEKSSNPKEVVIPMVTVSDIEGAVKSEIKVVKKDIHFIKTSFGKIHGIDKYFWETPWVYLFGAVFPPLIAFFLYRVLARFRKFQTDNVYAKKKKANQKALKALEKIVFEKGRKDDFYQLLAILSSYLSDKFNFPAGLHSEEFIDRLEKAGLSSELCEELAKIYSIGDAAKFGNITTESLSGPELKAKIHNFISSVEKEVR